MAKKWFWRLAPWLVAVGLLVWVERIIPLDETWATLRGLGWAQIGALVLLNGLIMVLLNGRWYFIARGHGYPVSFWALFGYRLAAFGVSYFTPGPHFGGEPLQIYLLQKRQGMARSTAVATLVLDKSLELWVNYAFLTGGLITVLFWGILPNVMEGHFLIFALGLLALPTGFLAAVWRGYNPMSRLIGWLHGRLGQRQWGDRWGRLWRWLPGAVARTEGEITLFCQRRPLFLLAAFLVSVLSWLVVFIEYWFVLSQYLRQK
jgi:glycosyltransferase 2 family protein